MKLATGSATAEIDRELLDAMYWTDFGAFTYQAYEALNPGQPLIPTGTSRPSATASSKW